MLVISLMAGNNTPCLKKVGTLLFSQWFRQKWVNFRNFSLLNPERIYGGRSNQNVHSLEMYTLHRRLERQSCRRATSLAWINIGNGKGPSLWVQQQYEYTQASGPCTPDHRPFEPKINKFPWTVEDYYCAKFQAIPIRGFHFIVLTYTPTCIVTKWSQYLRSRTTSWARIKTVTSPPICCRTAMRKVSVQLYSFTFILARINQSVNQYNFFKVAQVKILQGPLSYSE